MRQTAAKRHALADSVEERRMQWMCARRFELKTTVCTSLCSIGTAAKYQSSGRLQIPHR